MTTASSSGSGPLRLALLGCGHIGQAVYLPLLRGRADAHLSVIADASDEARKRASKLTGNGVPVIADWRDALGRDDLDGVIVALPSALHAEAACAAFARRLHVYVEKPLATSASDAQAVLAAHRAAGTFGTVGFNYRFNPLYRELRARVRSGAIGNVRVVRTIFSSPRRATTGWRESRGKGGGVLLELGSHHADLIRWLTGAEAATIQCLVTGGDDASQCTSVHLGLDSGASAQMLLAFGTIAEDRVEVIGDGGAIHVNRYRSLMPEVRGVDVPGRIDTVKGLWRSLAHLPYLLAKMASPWHEPSHGTALDRFVGGTQGVASDGPTLADGLASLRIVLAAEESAASGRTVLLE